MPGIMRLVGGKPIEVCSDWEIATHGEWNATWELRRSYDTVAQADTNYLNWQWTTIKSFGQTPYEERKNWALSGSEKLPCRMVLVCTAASSLPLAPMMYFRTLAGQREYKFRITSVADERHASATVLSRYLDRPASFATRAWSYGAFGPTMGYPTFSSYYQNRLWFGGIPNLPPRSLPAPWMISPASAREVMRMMHCTSPWHQTTRAASVGCVPRASCWWARRRTSGRSPHPTTPP